MSKELDKMAEIIGVERLTNMLYLRAGFNFFFGDGWNTLSKADAYDVLKLAAEVMTVSPEMTNQFTEDIQEVANA